MLEEVVECVMPNTTLRNGATWTWHPTDRENYIGKVVGLERLDERHFAEYPNLKFVATPCTGLDHLPLEYLKERGIKVISLQGETDFLEGVHATAEMTIALMLALVRRIPFAFNDVKQGNWNREAWQGMELHGKTLGIVGYGRVGRQVAEIAKGFGMRVLWCDDTSKAYLIPRNMLKAREDGGYDIVGMQAIIELADIVTVHVPLTEETRNMFGREQFAMMKPTSYFINTSRGQVVDETALLDALETKKIAGAALDVLTNEPNVELIGGLISYADTHENLLITCHLGGNTRESREKTQCFIARQIKEYINEGR